jgi:hypothetical protein
MNNPVAPPEKMTNSGEELQQMANAGEELQSPMNKRERGKDCGPLVLESFPP